MINGLPMFKQNENIGQQQFNMMATLKRRMAKAITKKDAKLLHLLVHEQKQLETRWQNSSAGTTSKSKFALIWEQWGHAVASRSQVSVERMTDSRGHEWWHVADPRSGKTFNAESLDVVTHWIEENRLG